MMNSGNRLRILLVEDDPGDICLIKEMLPKTDAVHYEFLCTDNLSEAVTCLNRKCVDIVLLDLDLPDSKGLDTIASLREVAPDIPVVVLTGYADEDTKIGAVLGGVQDYLIKGRTPADMLARVLCHAVERQRSEDRLRESERFLRSTLEALPSMIAILDDAGTILMANKAWRRFAASGSTPKILVGEGETYPDIDRFPADGNSEGAIVFAASVRTVLENSQSYIEMEFSCSGEEGRRWFNGRATHFNSSQARKVIVSIDEITQRKETEQALHTSQEQIRQVQKMESVGRLAGGVAHDFNNLLSPIIGYSELLLIRFAADEDGLKPLKEILKAGNSARELVHQLLAFGRKQPLKIKTVQINDVISGFEGLLHRTIRENVQLRMALAPELPCIQGDIGQLEQILINLAVNAQDAMPTGGTLIIETADVTLDEAYAASHRGVDAGHYVMLAVSDTGHGMTPEIQAQIFEPFFTTKERDKGTGLGLATVYGVVKQHGGSIWVYSEPGRGSTFKIYLPATRDCATPAEKEKAPRQDVCGTETIMVVEDEAAVRELAVNILESHGYRVLSAASGTEGLSMIENQDAPLHLLVTDIIMPVIDGYALYEKAALMIPGLKVLYMSGYTNEVIHHSGSLPEGAIFIQKPFALRDLVQMVRQVLDDK